MGIDRTAWHVNFVELISERRPPGFDILSEVQLTTEPQRGDLLLLRREGEARRDVEARVLRGLWHLLATDTLVEFKSVARPVRRGDVARLLGYGVQYLVSQIERPLVPANLTMVLVVPNITPTLRDELAWLGWTHEPLGGGYGRLHGSVYATYLVVIDEVAVAEDDDLLGSFGHIDWNKDETLWWWNGHLNLSAKDIAMQHLEGYEEMVQRLIEKLPPERRLASVANLPLEQRLLALPDDTLRALSDEYLRSLSPEFQEAIRKRIGRPPAT